MLPSRHGRLAILDDVRIAGFEQGDDEVGDLAGPGGLLPLARRRLLHLTSVPHAQHGVADERRDEHGRGGQREAVAPRIARRAVGQ